MEQNLIKKKYRLIDHTADIGIEVFGDDLPQLFSNAGYALFDIIADLSLVKEKASINVSVNGRNLEELMVNWLGELLYIFETKHFIVKYFNIIHVETSYSTSSLLGDVSTDTKSLEMEKVGRLFAEIKGENYDSGVHVINTTIKAVTYHQLQVFRDNNGWHLRVILDV